MILGVGVDICQVSRMEEAISHPRFFERVFSEGERDYLASRGAGAAQSAAGMYAAKEAYLKARGTGIDSLALGQIEITHTALGQPFYRLHGAYENAQVAARLSVSHDAGIAVAFCVLEQAEKTEGDGDDERA